MGDNFADDSPRAEQLYKNKAKRLVLADYDLLHKSVQIDTAMLRHQSSGVCWCDKCERKAPAPAVVHNKRVAVKNIVHTPAETDGSPPKPRAPLRTNKPVSAPAGIRISSFLLRVVER